MATKQTLTHKTNILLADFTHAPLILWKIFLGNTAGLEQVVDSGRICSSRGIHFAGSHH